MADFNIFGTAPESLAGLLGEQATKDLQRKAMTTGLINTALGYLVQPKNQNLGLGRIIGQSLMSGMTGAQGVYSGALEDWQTKQKIEEIQRQKAQREAFDTAAKSLYTNTPAQYATEQISGGGYMPSTTQVAGGTAPNFNVSSQYAPPTTQQVMTAPSTQSLNQNALTSMLLSGDNKANNYLAGLETIKKLQTPVKADLINIAEGGSVYDPSTGKIVATGSPKTVNPSNFIQNYEYAVSKGYKGTPEDWQKLTIETANQFQQPYKTAEQQMQERETAYKYGDTPTTPVVIPKIWTAQDVKDTAASSGKTIAQVQADLKKRNIKVRGY